MCDPMEREERRGCEERRALVAAASWAALLVNARETGTEWWALACETNLRECRAALADLWFD